MFFVFAGACAAVTVLFSVMKDGSEGLRRGWWFAILLAPTWLSFRFGPINIGCRDVAGGLGLLMLFAMARKDKMGPKFIPLPSDVAIVVLFAVCTLSRMNAGLFTPLTLIDIAREWLLPYLVGRFFILRSDDLKSFLPFGIRLLMVAAFLDVFEGLVQINILAKVTGERFGLLEAGEGYRWGLKRAHCATQHPIYNGLLMCMMFPWSVQAFNARKMLNKKLWIFMPLVGVAAAFFTASRGPHAALIISIGIFFFFRMPKLRIPLGVIGGGLGLTVVLFAHQIKEFAGSLEGKEEKDYPTIIMIDGEPYEYTGTKHRDLLEIVYEKACEQVPLFGYGLKMKGVPIEEHLVDRFWSIDNHYMLFFLQNGPAGHFAFLFLTIAMILQSLVRCWNVKDGRSLLAGGIAATTIGVAILIKSVWFSPCYGQVYLFHAGLSAALLTAKNDAGSTDDDTLEDGADKIPPPCKNTLPHKPIRRLSPSYAP